MSTPDKTSETLDLAEAMNSNPSASGSSDDNAVSKAKSVDDQQNANVTDMAKRLNEIDMAFRNTVITKESSSDSFVHVHPTQPPPPTSFSPGSDASEVAGSGMSSKANANLTTIKNEGMNDATPANAELSDQLNVNKGADAGSVYDRVLKIQRTDPKKYVPKEFARKEKHEIENIQVLPEILNCPKCNRKVAAGAIDYHVKFCNPDADHTQ